MCEQFGVDSSQQSAMVREYQLTVHQDLPKEKVFVGEPHRLGSYQNQKPYVLFIVTRIQCTCKNMATRYLK